MNRTISIVISTFFLLLFVGSDVLYSADTTSVEISCSTIKGVINENVWGVGAPDKYSWWAGNENLMARIREAKIKIVRVGPVQLGMYNGRDIYPSENNWNWDDLDAILNTIWDAGAQPLFLVCGYPGAVTEKDWDAYATFMEGIVYRYNVVRALGENKYIKYWEMWNEPTIEGDGTLTKEEFKSFVEIVGSKMKETDPSILLVGPADAWSDLSTTGYVAYAAENLSDLIDVLSWHDYGPDPSESDAARMSWTKPHYYDNLVKGRTSFGDFGAAITEFNISHADGGVDYNKKYRNEFGATYMASAIINAFKAGAELFNVYNFAESGGNLLGIVNNSDYTPYLPYYTYYLFGNYSGQVMMDAKGGNSFIEYIVSKDTINNKFFFTVINKNTAGKSYDLTVRITDILSNSGNIIVRKIDSNSNPKTISGAITYSNSEFNYTIEPYSVVNFEIFPSMLSNLNEFSSEPLILYPNPVKANELNLQLAKVYNPKAIVTVFNILGEAVYIEALDNLSETKANYTLNISALPAGMYYLNLSAGEKTITKVFLKE